jgi:hypothetical protein
VSLITTEPALATADLARVAARTLVMAGDFLATDAVPTFMPFRRAR